MLCRPLSKQSYARQAQTSILTIHAQFHSLFIYAPQFTSIESDCALCASQFPTRKAFSFACQKLLLI